MENPVYRITVEAIGDEKGHEIGDSLRNGIECDGFAILANKDKGAETVIHRVSSIDLASIMACNDELMGASFIAKAMREACDLKESKPIKALAGILGSISK